MTKKSLIDITAPKKENQYPKNAEMSETNLIKAVKIFFDIKNDNEKFKYDCALLNVSKYEHYVEKCNTDRILFSIMFVDKDFETVKNYLS